MLAALRNACYVLGVKTEERVSISAFVDVDEHERLVERARMEDRSVSAEIRLALAGTSIAFRRGTAAGSRPQARRGHRGGR